MAGPIRRNKWMNYVPLVSTIRSCIQWAHVDGTVRGCLQAMDPETLACFPVIGNVSLIARDVLLCCLGSASENSNPLPSVDNREQIVQEQPDSTSIDYNFLDERGQFHMGNYSPTPDSLSADNQRSEQGGYSGKESSVNGKSRVFRLPSLTEESTDSNMLGDNDQDSQSDEEKAQDVGDPNRSVPLLSRSASDVFDLIQSKNRTDTADGSNSALGTSISSPCTPFNDSEDENRDEIGMHDRGPISQGGNFKDPENQNTEKANNSLLNTAFIGSPEVNKEEDNSQLESTQLEDGSSSLDTAFLGSPEVNKEEDNSQLESTQLEDGSSPLNTAFLGSPDQGTAV